MAIKSVKTLRKEKIRIDLTGQDGNAFVLLGIANSLCKQLKKEYLPIKEEMTSGDYDNLIKVFDREFGDYVDLYK